MTMFILYLLLSLLIVGCNSSGQQTEGQSYLSQESSLEQLYTSDSSTFAVLVNAYACHSCFLVLDKALDRLHETYAPVRFVGIARSGPDAVSKHRAFTGAKRVLPHAEGIFLDVNTSGKPDPWPPIGLKNGLFGKYSVVKTPALLFIRQGNVEVVLRYSDLFRKDVVDLQSSIEENAMRLDSLLRLKS